MSCRCGRVKRVAGQSIRETIQRALALRGLDLAGWCVAWAEATGRDPVTVCRAARSLLRRLEAGQPPQTELHTWLTWALEADLPGAIPAALVPRIASSPYAYRGERQAA